MIDTNSDLNDSISPKGTVHIIVHDINGEIVQEVKTRNTVVKVGKSWIVNRFTTAGASANAPMSHMAIGTGTTAVATTDTSITEVSPGIVELDSTDVSDAVNGVVTFTAVFPAGTPSTTQSITEAGIFNASSSGTMLCRTVFQSVSKTATDSMTIIWSITLT